MNSLYKYYLIFLFLVALLVSCIPPEPVPQNHTAEVMADKRISSAGVKTTLADTVYVPAYSEIYSRTKDISFLLTATLSIRNTSLHDSIFLNRIDYFNTKGDLV